MIVSFIGGGNWSARWKPLTNFITYWCIKYTSLFELTTLVVIDTVCIGSCKSNYHTPEYIAWSNLYCRNTHICMTYINKKTGSPYTVLACHLYCNVFLCVWMTTRPCTIPISGVIRSTLHDSHIHTGVYMLLCQSYMIHTFILECTMLLGQPYMIHTFILECMCY